MNFREVRDKVAEVADSIRKEPHPAFLEVRTYRYRGHSMSDPASYRTKEELEKYRLDDPIIRLRAQLTREGKLTNEQFDQLDKQAKETVLAAVKFAEESPELPARREPYTITSYFERRQDVREITYRQALKRSARRRAERDPNVFLMGEEVAEYQGAYKVSQDCSSVLGPNASSTRRSARTDLPGWESARQWSACGRSLSS